MLTVERLTAEVGLALATGTESGAARVRGVHSTEPPDPTPWLTGGELVLSTGAQVAGAHAQDDEALRSYSESVLGPMSGEQPGYGEELLRSLDVFLEHSGHWEHAAAERFCHRHTLRYRLRRVERLTGRDLASTRDRIEFWLALRGRELTP